VRKERTEGGSERGSVTFVAVAVIGLVMALVLLSADMCRVLVAGARAQTAADAAALAAVQDMAVASGDPPAAAAAFASANGAVLESCSCSQADSAAQVTVSADAGDLLLLYPVGVVRAEARAEIGMAEASPAPSP
jgi:secretion/DNA translocation related TadE-like protein